LTQRGRIVALENGSCESRATGQFDIADERPPAEVAAMVQRLGYEPVWKDWDAALSS
jgi:2-iminoacetate synthase